MRNFTGNGYGNAPRNSRELLMARLSKSFPDRSFDDENLFFDSLLEYEEDMRKRYDYLCQDQMKLADIFMANPRMAEFIGDVLGGDDALAAWQQAWLSVFLCRFCLGIMVFCVMVGIKMIKIILEFQRRGRTL